MTIKKPINAVKAVLPFAAKNDLRYYLNGVSFYVNASNEIVAVAGTNGHTLCVVGDITTATNQFVLGHDEVKRLLVNGFSAVELTDNMEVIIASNTYNLIDGRYPDIRRVIPAAKRNVDLNYGIGFNPDYVALISKSQKELTKGLPKSKRGIINGLFTFGGANESMRVDFEHEEIDSMVCVIVPVRL